MIKALRWRYFAYNTLLALAAVPASPWLVWQFAAKRRRRVGVAQRLGDAPRGKGKVIWVHAVSVGEVRAVVPVLTWLRRLKGKEFAIYLSTTTVTGQETARRECPQADEIFYFPFDLPWAVNKALDHVRPVLFVTVETELWPNFLAACAVRGIPTAVTNGRLSDRSFARYQRLRWFFGPYVAALARCLMQSGEDARRIMELGADPDRVQVTGNTKYDRSPRLVVLPGSIPGWKGTDPVLVAGSTHQGEEEALLDLMADPAAEAKRLKLVLAPRHPQRFDEVASLLDKRKVPYARYSRVALGEPTQGRVLLVDTMGLLDTFYSLADVAFVGGSLVPVGGHNLLEPAMLGKPVITGPNVQNFRDVAEALLGGGGARMVRDGAELGRTVLELLDNPVALRTMGQAAKRVSEQASGAARMNADALLALLAAR